MFVFGVSCSSIVLVILRALSRTSARCARAPDLGVRKGPELLIRMVAMLGYVIEAILCLVVGISQWGVLQASMGPMDGSTSRRLASSMKLGEVPLMKGIFTRNWLINVGQSFGDVMWGHLMTNAPMNGQECRQLPTMSVHAP